jgi:regulator of protease activity HflC (stomatin/prohibitin superfamily)
MKKVLLASVVAMFALLNGCSVIQPGHVGIVVNNYGSEKGVANYTAQTGVVWFNPLSTHIFNYPTFVQTAIWTASLQEGKPINEEITFNTKEGTSVSGDISLGYQLNSEKVPSFYVKFRSDDLDLFTHGFLHNIARDAFNELGSQYTLEEVYGLKKEEYLKAVKARVNAEVNQYGVDVIQFGFTGALRMDPGIMGALNKKLQAIQDAITSENQLRQSEADARKMVARAEGEAKSNALLSQSITPVLVQWKNLEITAKAIDKWNGQRPMVEGSTNGLLLQIPLPAQK